jgi:Ser/Thr protein kinase RdoA (MazF antagonist)
MIHGSDPETAHPSPLTTRSNHHTSQPSTHQVFPVLAQYPDFSISSVTPLGNRGGFSGARLWKVDSRAGAFALKAWPEGSFQQNLHALRYRHGLMHEARKGGLSFVPAVQQTRAGTTWVWHEGRAWDLIEWLPGRADYHAHPNPSRLRATARGLAQLHAAWGQGPSLFAGPIPAVQRRVACLREWQLRLEQGWRPTCSGTHPLDPLAERAWRHLSRWLGGVTEQLRPWREVEVVLQPCLCDVWHDHLLFDGDRLTGLIDYGAVKTDHVAVDLARMLGSLVGDDPQGWRRGLDAYTGVRPLEARDEQLARMLDTTGTILALANWLSWLQVEHRVFEDPTTVSRRLSALVERVDAW